MFPKNNLFHLDVDIVSMGSKFASASNSAYGFCVIVGVCVREAFMMGVASPAWVRSVHARCSAPCTMPF